MVFWLQAYMHLFIHVVSIWIIWYDSFKWLLIQHRSVKISFWFSSFWGNVDSRLNLKMITWLILFDSDSWMITNKWLQLIDHKPTLLANRFVTSYRLPEAPALTEYNTAACSISMKLNLFHSLPLPSQNTYKSKTMRWLGAEYSASPSICGLGIEFSSHALN